MGIGILRQSRSASAVSIIIAAGIELAVSKEVGKGSWKVPIKSSFRDSHNALCDKICRQSPPHGV